MRFIRQSLLTMAFCAVAGGAAADYCAVPYTSVTCLGPAQTASSGVNKVGFTLAQGTGTLDAMTQFAEISRSSNVVGWRYDPADPDFTGRLTKAAGDGHTAFIYVDSIFKKPDGTLYTDEELRPRLYNLYVALTVPIRRNYVYLGFEAPVWQAQRIACGGVDSCVQNGPTAGVLASTNGLLESWANTLRSWFPGAGIFLTEAHPVIRDSLTLPKNFDVYAFSCLGAFDQCSSSNGTTYSIPQMLGILKGKVQALNATYGGYRQLGLIPETMISYSPLDLRGGAGGSLALAQDALLPGNARTEAEVNTLLRRYVALAESEPMVTTMLGYLWANQNEGGRTYIGLRGFSTVVSGAEAYARSRSGRQFLEPQATAPVVDFQASPNVRVNGSGAIWSWGAYGATSCRSVTAPNFAAQPSAGAVYLPPEKAAGTVSHTIECVNASGADRKTISYSVAP